MSIQDISIADKTTLDAVNTKVDATVSSRSPASTALSTENWTTTRAGKLDNLDAAISGRAPASTALSNATWTSARAGYLDSINTNAARLTAARATVIDNIGATTDTGGSPTAGTAMAKLNKLIGDTGEISDVDGVKYKPILQKTAVQDVVKSLGPSGGGIGPDGTNIACFQVFYDENYLYYITSATTLVKANKDTLATVAQVSLGGSAYFKAFCQDNDYIYIAHNNGAAAFLYKYAKATMTLSVTSAVAPLSQSYIWNIAVNDTHVFTLEGASGTTPVIRKFLKSDLSLVATGTVMTTTAAVSGGAKIVANNTYIYVTPLGTGYLNLTRWLASDLSLNATITNTLVNLKELWIDSQYAYYGTSGVVGASAAFVRIPVANFDLAHIEMIDHHASPMAFGIDANNIIMITASDISQTYTQATHILELIDKATNSCYPIISDLKYFGTHLGKAGVPQSIAIDGNNIYFGIHPSQSYSPKLCKFAIKDIVVGYEVVS